MLFLALENERENIFTKGKKINFCECWDYLNLDFMRKRNITFEGHKMLNGRQRDRKRLEGFRGTFAQLAKKSNISGGEEKWM